MKPSVGALWHFSQKDAAEFFKQARRCFKSSGLLFLCNQALHHYGRILVVTPRKCGNAPERNRIRRQLKALFYELELYKKHYDIAVIVYKNGIKLSFNELKIALITAIKKATNEAT